MYITELFMQASHIEFFPLLKTKKEKKQTNRKPPEMFFSY